MDYFFIIFIIATAVGLFLFWKFVKFLYKKLVGILPKVDESQKFREGDPAADISGKFEDTVRELEAERLIYYTKTKGLFKRAFLRAWLVISFIFIALAITLSESDQVDVIMFIGPIIGSALLSAIGVGIYTLIKKGTNLSNFTRILKKELVSKIVKEVNPNLTFYDEGIDEEEFNKADIFPDHKNTSLKSEDKIEGLIDATKVIISECIKQGRVSSTHRTNVKVKGVTVSRGRMETGQDDDIIEYFRGLFIQLELKSTSISTLLKVVPANRVRKEVKTGFDFKGRAHLIKPVSEYDLLKGILELENKPYEIYCSEKDEASQLVNDTFIKVLDFIYDKYYGKRESNDGNSAIGSLLFKERAVYITIRDSMLYMALDWNKDMFEPDMLLKKNLEESGIAQEIYEDLLFINQVIKEVNLFNKVAV